MTADPRVKALEAKLYEDAAIAHLRDAIRRLGIDVRTLRKQVQDRLAQVEPKVTEH